MVTLGVAALAATSLPGCALLSPANVEMTTATLDKMPQQLPHLNAHPATLLVFPPEATAIYDTTRMAYTLRPYEVAYFSHHQWGEKPSRMLQTLLVRTLATTGYFSAVLTPPYTDSYTYALHTEILELVQDFTPEPPTLRLSLHLQLRDDVAGRLVATRDILLREPMQQKAPYAGVVAANEAMAKALLEIAAFVLEKAK
jgi:cholesterol transport system auxiliary component